MKSLPLALIALGLPLLLTGCASSPSLEDQTKLIEYEKCLQHRENIRLAVGEILDQQWADSNDDKRLEKRLEIAFGAISADENELLGAFKKTLEACEDLRP